MADKEFDLIVVGGGPGGYVTAIRAAQLGGKVALVEREHLGGICLNWGCIPTKALLRTAEIYRYMGHAKDFGLSAEKIAFDLDAVVKRSRKVAARLSGGVQHLLKKNKVTVFDGHGKLDGVQGSLRKLAVTKDDKPVADLLAENIVLATGARARELPGLEADGKLIWSYKEALVPTSFPETLLVVGSGAIGIEFASFFDALGSKVTVVEILPSILPAEDEEISQMARKSLEKQGLRILTDTKVENIRKEADSVRVTLNGGGKSEEATFSRIISAVGIVGNWENLGLENTKVQVEKTHVVTDEWLATGEPNVYAIGDLAGPPWLAHKASHEGIICVEKLAGSKDVHPMTKTRIPGCTYCHPQVASVGLSEKRAKEAGRDIKVGRFPFMGNGKAIALGEPDGMIKTVFDAKSGELLGAHMIGAEVTELIQGYAVAMQLETTELDLMHTVFPHPTLSEMMHESVLDAYGRAIHS